MKNGRRGNYLGIISIVLTAVFQTYASSRVGPNAFTQSVYMIYLILPGILVGAALMAIAAAFWGSKWWLLALLGPASGALLLLTASA